MRTSCVVVILSLVFLLKAIPLLAQDASDEKIKYEQCKYDCSNLLDKNDTDEESINNKMICLRKCVDDYNVVLKKKQEEDEKMKLDQAQKREQAEEEAARKEQVKLIGLKVMKACNNSVYYFQDLLGMNPYDAKGKCFYLQVMPMVQTQILSRTTALMLYPDQPVYVDFGKLSVPAKNAMRTFIVKGDSKPFKYKSAAGSAVTAPRVTVLKEIVDDEQ